MYNMVLLLYFVGVCVLAVCPWILSFWAYQDEADWRWREELLFRDWLLENKHFAILSFAISMIAFLGLTVHP